ncbi:MAG: sulfite exporter TauE/SafE family protein [Proteobacteria bacterium]|nr:sulfite exporter TauE/SafE family protein [Pseudomonadota bacterium]
MIEIFEYVLVGVGVGVVSSYLGFGGGTIIVPFLPLISGYDIKTTLATSLVVVCMNATMNTVTFSKQRLVPWKLVSNIALGAGLASLGSSFLTSQLPVIFLKSLAILMFLFLMLVSYFGVKMLPKVFLSANFRNHVAAGMVLGTASGLSGVGGGTFLVPVLAASAWVTTSQVSPVGNALNMISAFVGATTMFLSGSHVQWGAALGIFSAAFLTSFVANQKQHLMSADQRKKYVTAFLAIVVLIQIVDAARLHG